MSTFGTNEGRVLSFTAGADLSGAQYQLVKMSAEGTVVLSTAAADNHLGVILQPGKQGDRVSVGMLNGDGTHYVKAAGAITAGAVLTSNAAGKATTATQAIAGAQPTTTAIGTALNTVANADSLVAFVPEKFKY